MGLCVLTPLPLLGLPTTSPSPPAPPSSPPSLLPPPLILSRSLVASEGLPVGARLAELREPPRSTHPSPTLFLFSSYENPGWKEVLGYERFHPDPTPSTDVTRSGWFALPEHRIVLCKWGGGVLIAPMRLSGEKSVWCVLMLCPMLGTSRRSAPCPCLSGDRRGSVSPSVLPSSSMGAAECGTRAST